MATLVDRLRPMPVDVTINDKMRFWSFIGPVEPNGCRLWRGTRITGHDSYGSLIDVRGTFCLRGQQFIAARVAYYFEFGDDPGKQLVCHECNNPLCVNPTHLFLGSQSENMRHMIASDRRVGSNHSTFSDGEIRDIRRRIAAGENYAEIARTLGVNKTTIRRIGTGQHYQHVRQD